MRYIFYFAVLAVTYFYRVDVIEWAVSNQVEIFNWLKTNPTAVLGTISLGFAYWQIRNNRNISRDKNTLDGMLKLSTDQRLVDGKLALNAYIDCDNTSLEKICAKAKKDPCIVIDYLNYVEILCSGKSRTINENLLILNIGDIVIRCEKGIKLLQDDAGCQLDQKSYPSIRSASKKSILKRAVNSTCSACASHTFTK